MLRSQLLLLVPLLMLQVVLSDLEPDRHSDEEYADAEGHLEIEYARTG